MAQNWRSSVWSKLSALGFIILVILGNIWFIEGLTGREAPKWLQILFLANVLGLLISGLGLGTHILWNIYRAKQVDMEAESVEEQDQHPSKGL